MSREKAIERIMEFVRGLADVDAATIHDGLKIRQIHRELEMAVEKYLETLGVSARRMEILEALYHHPDRAMTPAELADEVLLTRSAITGNLDSLQRAGYVRRMPHTKDRRMISVELTALGASFMDEALPTRYRNLVKIVGCLAPAERERMLEYYRRVAGSLDELTSESARPFRGAVDGTGEPRRQQ